MRYMKLLLSAAVVGALGMSAVAMRTQVTPPDKAELALRAAMETESVTGDLKAAIEQYRTIAATYARSNRAVAARALLRLAGCYEKLGREEAGKTYQQLLSEYADQTDVVAQARTRLAALTKATEVVASAPKFRRIEIPGKPRMNSAAMLSPDGNRIAFLAEGDIWTVPISGGIYPDIAGEPVRLTKGMGAWEAGNCTVTWSADGEWIAFRAKPKDSVYLVPALGGEPRRVDGVGPGPGGGAQFARISVSQGAKRIVFATGAKGELVSHLFTIPGEGGSSTQLASGIADDTAVVEPAFSPNGELVAYIKVEIADSSLVESIMVIPADGGEPVLVSSLPGTGHATDSPTWSPDGKRVYYRGNGDKNIESAAATGGDARSVPLRYQNNPMTVWYPTGSNEVSRDGRSIVFAGSSRDVGGIWTVPSQGGEARRVAVGPQASGSALNPTWSPDGKRIAYTHTGFAPARTGIWIVGSEGGSPKQLTSDADRVEEAEVRWSPDGKTIAYFGADKTLRLVPSDGGASRVLTQVPAVSGSVGLSWSPDGSRLAYSTIQKVFVVTASGGEPHEIPVGFDGSRITQLDWSPDGQTLAFTGVSGSEAEVWLMSDFLHLVKAAR